MKRKLLLVSLLTITFISTYLILSLWKNNSSTEINWEYFVGNLIDIGSIVLIGLLYIYSFSTLIDFTDEVRENSWRLLGVFSMLISTLLNYKYGGIYSITKDGLFSLFKEPIVWMLLTTLIAHLILLIYRKSKSQLNKKII